MFRTIVRIYFLISLLCNVSCFIHYSCVMCFEVFLSEEPILWKYVTLNNCTFIWKNIFCQRFPSNLKHFLEVLFLICYLYLKMCERKSRDLISPPTSLQKTDTFLFLKVISHNNDEECFWDISIQFQNETESMPGILE